MDDKNWLVETHPFTEDPPPPRGFLQLCADRRFHKLLQQLFKEDAKLPSREDYWIHADAGGTPMMADRKILPVYCYRDKKVRLMGWSAHGDGCGGFGEEVPDDVIQDALCKTMQKNVREYPEATHFIYFVTIRNGQTIVYRRVAKPGEDIICLQTP